MRALLLALLIIATPVMAAADIIMHRDPGCGCCEQWAARAEKILGRHVRVVDDAERATLQKHYGITPDLASCHTAIIDGYAIEGHVPLADVQRLLKMRPKGVRGLAVPGMPIGSPGMEVQGMKAQPYQVIAFGAAGQKIFAQH